MDRGVSEPAEVIRGDMARDLAVRHTSVIEVDSETLTGIDARLDGIRERVARFYSLPLGEREGPALLRYPTGGFHRPHRDRARAPSWPGAERRRIAVVVFLNGFAALPAADQFTGGELRLLEGPSGPVDIVPESGTLVAFPASTLHEVAPVRAGTRDTIVDWFY